MNKKILVALGLSGALFLLAGQALGAAYVPVSGSSAVMANTQTQAPAGSQMMFYGNGQNNLGFRTLSAQPLGAYAGRAAIWFGLMSVITIVLVWIVLIQLIFVLCHWLKKHKH